jgi:hypothetical protein
LVRALAAVERAAECFADLEDVDGRAEMIAKRATIMRLGGEGRERT